MAKATVKPTAEFEPVTIEITLETQRELDLFGAIFNYAPYCNISDGSDAWCEEIRTAVRNAGGDCESPIKEFNKSFNRK